MSSTRGSAFAGIVAEAKGQAIALLRDDHVELDDALYLLRALDDLEADGVELFNAHQPADDDFYRQIETYLGERIGHPLAHALALRPNKSIGGAHVNHQFLVHRRGDHVGVAVVDIANGEHVQGVFMDDETTIDVEAKATVPLGHKISIAALDAGAEVLEYGIPIGRATAAFEPGAYVHTHNLRSARW